MIRYLILIFCLVIGGCAVKGPAYSPVEVVPPDHGVVYVYRIDQSTNKGIKPGVVVDGQEFAALPAGGYMPFTLGAGPHEFRLLLSSNYKGLGSSQVSVGSGATSFLRLESALQEVSYRLFRRVFRLQQVTREVAAAEIVSCKLVDPVAGDRYSSSIFLDD